MRSEVVLIKHLSVYPEFRIGAFYKPRTQVIIYKGLELSSIRLIGNSAYSIGYNIFVGMSMTQILMLYPFADADDCSINFSGSLRSYSVTFDFDDNNIVESVKVST